MNDLVTPPGFVEYPRDSKFRKLDDLERLRLAGEAYCGLLWMGIVFAPLANTLPRHPVRIALGFLVTMIVLMILRSSLAKLYRSQGWKPRAVWLPVLLMGALLTSHVTGILPYWLSYCGSMAAIVGVGLFVHRVASTQFIKLGIKMPLNLDWKKLDAILEDQKLAKVFAELKQPEPQ